MDANNVKKTLSKNILADGFEPIIDLKKSHDSWLVDARNGDEYLDMFSMYASGAIGYNHPEIIKNKELLYEVSLFKPTLSDIYSTHYADFLETFNRIAIPNYLKNAFFIRKKTPFLIQSICFSILEGILCLDKVGLSIRKLTFHF